MCSMSAPSTWTVEADMLARVLMCEHAVILVKGSRSRFSTQAICSGNIPVSGLFECSTASVQAETG